MTFMMDHFHQPHIVVVVNDALNLHNPSSYCRLESFTLLPLFMLLVLKQLRKCYPGRVEVMNLII